MNTAQSSFNETDNTFSANTPPVGISGFMGVTKRGPINRPDILINSWPQFEKVYGGLILGNDFPLQCKRALDGGAALRVCGIRHYSDITNSNTLTPTFANPQGTTVYNLSGPMFTGHIITFTIGGTSVSQLYSFSSLNTLQLLKSKILAAFPSFVGNVIAADNQLKVAFISGTGTLAVSGAQAAVVGVLAKSGLITVATLGANGDLSRLKVTDADGISNPYIIAQFAKTVAETTTTLLVAALLATLAPTGSGYTQDSVAANAFKIQGPTGSGAGLNGKMITYESPSTSIPVTFTGGVTAVPMVSANPTVSNVTLVGVKSSAGVVLFTVTPKYPGAEYNKLEVVITKPSNNAIGYFDMVIRLAGDSYVPEEYTNLKIPGAANQTGYTFLAKPINQSELASFQYADLSALVVLPIVPEYNIIRFTGGTDGDPVIDTDYIGDSNSRTGFQAFNIVDDIMQLGYAGDSINVHIAGAAYAMGRKDLQYWAHLSNNLNTENLLVAERANLGINTTYVNIFAGGLRVLNPLTNSEIAISELGDMFALAANTDNAYGEWYSIAGSQRGNLSNILGVVNNFGSSNNTLGMNQLANAQINVVISRGKKKMLWGNFTAQVDKSTLSFSNVRRLIIHLKKTLKPLVDTYIEEPNDFLTWRKLYMEVKPILDGLGTKRAFYGTEGEGWIWQGDQFATKLSDLVVNSASDVSLGKYKARVFLKDVVSLQWIGIDIIMTSAEVSFEDAVVAEIPNF